VNTTTLGEIGGNPNRSDIMQKHGMIFTVVGIFIIVLSGLEKILIFLAHQGEGIIDNTALENLTPSLVWNVPKSTNTIGILILILGILLLVINSHFFKRQFELIKKNNEYFDNNNKLITQKSNEKNDEREM
jgi:ABC-type phosphate transport system permease subunit